MGDFQLRGREAPTLLAGRSGARTSHPRCGLPVFAATHAANASGAADGNARGHPAAGSRIGGRVAGGHGMARGALSASALRVGQCGGCPGGLSRGWIARGGLPARAGAGAAALGPGAPAHAGRQAPREQVGRSRDGRPAERAPADLAHRARRLLWLHSGQKLRLSRQSARPRRAGGYVPGHIGAAAIGRQAAHEQVRRPSVGCPAKCAVEHLADWACALPW